MGMLSFATGARNLCRLGFDRCDKLAARLLVLACGASWIIQEMEPSARFELVCDHAVAMNAVQGLWACSVHNGAVACVRALVMATHARQQCCVSSIPEGAGQPWMALAA
eukprot:13215670-Alexandrium_andersonii.AAC.1